ncbi:hypothetical protein NT6N_32370 [Oceaniferula spumae]|uniref:Uncharacterized protein n=1 Tax=Oceaniferula spumae TaxID=2979115 RepID=A0AAT9FPX0_9BACT
MPTTAQKQKTKLSPGQPTYRAPATKDLVQVKMGPNLGQRDRSVPYKRPFVLAVLSTLAFYLSVIALLAGIIAFFLATKELQHRTAYVIAGLLIACAFTWLFAYLMRRRATCPLCKCTPLLDNLALKHEKSFKAWPMNYGHTAVLNIVFTQRWRCMYCGTPFDITKTKLREPMSRSKPKKKRSSSRKRR